MPAQRTIHRGTARDFTVVVRTSQVASGWTLRYVFGYTEGSAGLIVLTLAYSSVNADANEYTFTASMTAAQSQLLTAGRSIEAAVWRTDSGYESVFPDVQTYEVADAPRAS